MLTWSTRGDEDDGGALAGRRYLLSALSLPCLFLILSVSVFCPLVFSRFFSVLSPLFSFGWFLCFFSFCLRPLLFLRVCLRGKGGATGVAASTGLEEDDDEGAVAGQNLLSSV